MTPRQHVPTSARQPAEATSTAVENDNQTTLKIITESVSDASGPGGKTYHQNYNYSDLEKVVETRMESVAADEYDDLPASTICKTNTERPM